MSLEKNLKLIIILSIIGIMISSYLLYTKYSDTKSFCDFSPEVSCDAVSQSPYSEFPANSGIPIAGLGILAYLIFIVPSYLMLKTKTDKILGFKKSTVNLLMFLWGIFSLLFYTYLTYLELYVIYSICPLCVVTFVITIIIFILFALNERKGV